MGRRFLSPPKQGKDTHNRIISDTIIDIAILDLQCCIDENNNENGKSHRLPSNKKQLMHGVVDMSSQLTNQF